MKKFGFSKKSGKSSPAPSDNPYAQAPPAQDPYAKEPSRPSGPSSSYSQSSSAGPSSSYSQGSPAGPSGGRSSAGPSGGPRVGLPSGPRGGGYGGGYGGGGPPPRPAAAQPPNGQGRSGPGYGSDKLGSGSGYGAARYHNEESFRQNQNISIAPPSSRPGGYGGLGGGVREGVGNSQDRLQPGPGGRTEPPREGPSAGRGGYGGMGREGPPQNNPYGGKPASGPPGGPSTRPANGLGNIGRTPSSSTEVNRGDLFGAAQKRYDPQQGNAYDATTRPAPEGRSGQPGASSVPSGSYDGYGEQRELTEDEKQELEVQNTMANTRQVRDESYQSTQRALRQMYDTVEVGRETLARLGTQGESLHNAERNMDMADNHNTRGYEKTKELQTVNRSMFAVHVANPFTAKKRAQARDDQIMERHAIEKEQREATRHAHYSEARMMEGSMRALNVNEGSQPSSQRVPREQNKFLFPDEDSDEEQKEEAIDRNLGDMFVVAGALKGLSTELGDVLDAQNGIIDRIGSKTDRVDYGVRRNRNELDKIR